MSEEAQAEQVDTSAEATDTQAQAPSEGGTMLKPAAAIEAEAADAKVEAEDANASTADAPSKGAEDLGLLKDTKPEEKEAAPEQYEFKMPEGMELDETEQALLQNVAKESKLTQDQAQQGAEFFASAMDAMVKENEARIEAFKAEQKQMWESQPDHAQRVLLADKALNHAGKEFKDYVMERGYQHDANLMKVFSEFGKLISEAAVVVGSEGSPSTGPRNPYGNSPEFNN